MLLIIDNNDSFTFNIVQLVKTVSSVKIDVVPYNKVVLEMLDVYSHIIFSPGPGLPSEYKIMYDVLKMYDSRKSILGICLKDVIRFMELPQYGCYKLRISYNESCFNGKRGLVALFFR